MGATPKDEIERQHQEAHDIVHGKVKSKCGTCLPMTPKAEIPLSWKQRPTVDDPYYRNGSSTSLGSATTSSTTGSTGSDNCSSSEDDGSLSENNSTVDDNGEDTCNPSASIKGPRDKDNNRRICIATRGVINADKIASFIREGYDYKNNFLTALDTNSTTKNTTTAKTTKTINKSKSSKTKMKRKVSSSLSSSTSSSTAPPPPSPTNLWDQRNAKTHNVSITRPSHDSWGINKIILLFCDDFLQTVYEMPYFHSAKYKELQDSLQPIFDTLQISHNRIVRLLFASLPPGVTIPIHHDTGEWVKYTHRVHVPIIVNNPNHILFRCGPTEESLQRVNCTPGHIFEMNNQAKHAVSNCTDTNHYRVHLILDYVDDNFKIKNRIKLYPGETIIQSRRSIDRAIDAGKRQTPSYMILGAQKCGTTSLYEYINQHPLVIRAKRRETHCFDWRWDDTLNTVQEQKKHCLSFFYAKDLHKYPSLMTGDSTPSYLLDSYRVIPRLKQVFHVKQHWRHIAFFVMLRNPTKRVKSHFEMVTSLDGTEAQIKTRGTEWLNKSIEEVIHKDFVNMNECGLIPYWDMENKVVDMEIFNSFTGTKAEDESFTKYLREHVKLNTGSHSIIVRGLYALQLRPWMESFDEKQFLVLKLEAMSNTNEINGVHKVMDQVWDHLDLPPFKIQDEEAKNSRSYKCEMKEETKEMLDRFYKPHNKRLSLLLKSNDMFRSCNGDPWQ